MDAVQDAFDKANYLFRKADHAAWHRQLSSQQILRSQVGFTDTTPSRPKPCQNCINYHGIAYGHSRDNRAVLICGFHPLGWQGLGGCPDWQGAEDDNNWCKAD